MAVSWDDLPSDAAELIENTREQMSDLEYYLDLGGESLDMFDVTEYLEVGRTYIDDLLAAIDAKKLFPDSHPLAP